jgi:heterodisulfide reductase subunit C
MGGSGRSHNRHGGTLAEALGSIDSETSHSPQRRNPGDGDIAAGQGGLSTGISERVRVNFTGEARSKAIEARMRKIDLTKESRRFCRGVQDLTGENVDLCYQCRKCSLGCPTAYEMSLKPHEMMRAIQLGLEEEVFESGIIWMCISCETCNTRCPQNINIVRVIDGLRELVMSGRVNYFNPYPEIPAMYRLFLKLIQRYGWVYDVGLISILNLKMVDPFKDIDIEWPLAMKGRRKLLPRKSGGVDELRRIVSKIRHMEEES